MNIKKYLLRSKYLTQLIIVIALVQILSLIIYHSISNEVLAFVIYAAGTFICTLLLFFWLLSFFCTVIQKKFKMKKYVSLVGIVIFSLFYSLSYVVGALILLGITNLPGALTDCDKIIAKVDIEGEAHIVLQETECETWGSGMRHEHIWNVYNVEEKQRMKVGDVITGTIFDYPAHDAERYSEAWIKELSGSTYADYFGPDVQMTLRLDSGKKYCFIPSTGNIVTWSENCELANYKEQIRIKYEEHKQQKQFVVVNEAYDTILNLDWVSCRLDILDTIQIQYPVTWRVYDSNAVYHDNCKSLEDIYGFVYGANKPLNIQFVSKDYQFKTQFNTYSFSNQNIDLQNPGEWWLDVPRAKSVLQTSSFIEQEYHGIYHINDQDYFLYTFFSRDNSTGDLIEEKITAITIYNGRKMPTGEPQIRTLEVTMTIPEMFTVVDQKFDVMTKFLEHVSFDGDTINNSENIQ